MSKLKKIREKFNLTQQELSEKSGISVRTIQRIESGTDPKGQTLKILARTLAVNESEFLREEKIPDSINSSLLKVINLSSLPFVIIPPVNILLPLLLMFVKKQFNPLAKQVVSVQIVWTVIAVVLFMLASFIKNWFSFDSWFILVVMISLVLSNIFIILRNAAEIDKKDKLYFQLSFSII